MASSPSAVGAGPKCASGFSALNQQNRGQGGSEGGRPAVGFCPKCSAPQYFRTHTQQLSSSKLKAHPMRFSSCSTVASAVSTSCSARRAPSPLPLPPPAAPPPLPRLAAVPALRLCDMLYVSDRCPGWFAARVPVVGGLVVETENLERARATRARRRGPDIKLRGGSKAGMREWAAATVQRAHLMGP